MNNWNAKGPSGSWRPAACGLRLGFRQMCVNFPELGGRRGGGGGGVRLFGVPSIRIQVLWDL